MLRQGKHFDRDELPPIEIRLFRQAADAPANTAEFCKQKKTKKRKIP